MAEDSPKKPKKMKDLKARLGRTIAPTGGGAAPIAPPNLGGGAAGGDGDAVPPPSGIVAPSVAKNPTPSAGVVPSGPSVVKPAFIREQEAEEEARKAKAEAAKARREMKIVVDDSDVEDAMDSKRARVFIAIVGAIAIVIGFGIGKTLQEKWSEDERINLAIEAARDIRDSVGAADDAVQQIRTHTEAAIASATASPPTINVDALRAMQAIQIPFDAHTFSGKNYTQFQPATVDAIFDYYLKVTELSGAVQVNANRGIVPASRTAIETAIQSLQDTGSSPIACAVVNAGGRLACDMVWITGPLADGRFPTAPQRRGGTPTPRGPFNPGSDLAPQLGNTLILVNTGNSQGVLGENARAFAEYLHGLNRMKAQLDAIDEARATVRQGLEEIANLDLR